MWDPQDFERHWRAEFPGQAAPAMRLDSALDVERELERCKLHLRRLQQVSAEEKFKVSYLQAVLAGGARRLEGADGGAASAEEPAAAAGPEEEEKEEEEEEEEGAAGGEPPGPARPGPELAAQAEPPCVCPDLPAWPAAAGPGAAVCSLTAAIHQQLLQPRLLFRPREDRAPPGRDGAAPGSPPGAEPASGARAGRGSEEAEPGAEDGGDDDDDDGSDHDFEMVDVNEKFALGHLLVAPCRFGTRAEADQAARAGSPHRWMHLIPGGRRLQRRSRDLEQLEPEARDGRGSPVAPDEAPRRGARDHHPRWRRKGLLWVPERDSPGHSSPERGSDCSHNSSDHEDGSSAASWGIQSPLPLRAAKPREQSCLF